MSYYDWKPYVPVAKRREQAEKMITKAQKAGQAMAPVPAARGAITKTFWGKSWCENLERYSDYANRLPRGRTYVRNGSVIDLQIGAGRITAQVMGSSLYRVDIDIVHVSDTHWKKIAADCAGSIATLVELLQGRFSKAVMERISRAGDGLFPAPKDIGLKCSCPDWASMCKHVAAVLYGIGKRLDEQPELLFTLRGVDASELVANAGSGFDTRVPVADADKVLDTDAMADVFGIEMATLPATAAAPAPRKAATKSTARPAAKSDAKAATSPAGEPVLRTRAKASAKASANVPAKAPAKAAPGPVTLYGIKNCVTMKKAFAWLDEHGMPYTFHDYKQAAVPRARLAAWCRALGWRTLLNTRGTTWRKLTPAQQAARTQAAAIALMLEHPGLIKRPVVEGPAGQILAGFDPATFESLSPA